MTSSAITRSSEPSTRARAGTRATASSAIGFALDFYDLYVIVFVAPVIARLFFDFASPTVALAGAYVTLAATLLMRPVGALLLGHVADRHGRKRAMVIGLTGVGAATGLMGVLPVEAQAGVVAPVALLVLRLVQGLFVGGVFASTLTLATESVPARWRGLASGLVGGGGTAAGSVLAALALLATTRLFPGAAFDQWGWRAMFLLGALPIVMSLLVLRYVEESPEWTPAPAGARSPLAELCAPGARRHLLLGIGVVLGIGTHFLLTLGFLPTLLQVVNGVPASSVAPLLVVVNLLAMTCAPLTGHLSQRWGRRRVMLVSIGVNVVALPPLFRWLAGVPYEAGVLALFVPVLLISGLAVAAFGPMPIFLNERFRTATRASGTAVSINVGFALAGLAPVAVNASSAGPSALPGAVGVAVALGGLISLACLLASRDRVIDLD